MEYCFGVDIGGTFVKLGLFTVEGELLEKWQIKTRREDNSSHILPDIAEALEAKLEEKGIFREEVVGIGFGTPGPVTEDGVAVCPANLDWENKPVAKELTELTGFPARGGNDVNVAGLGEMWRGGAKGYKNVVVVPIGTGLGAAIVVNGKIKSKASEKIKKNRVISTSPAKGKNVKKGTKVTIIKSKGKDTIELEDYTGENSIEIKTLLETKYGLVVTIEKKEVTDNNSDVSDDTIIGQSLAAGTKVKEGDTLVLYVPEDAKLFVDMVSEGWTKDDVEALCTEYDLNCVYTPVETNTYSEGKIISQSRRVGSTISKGSSLTVEYAIKPKKTASPSPSASVSPSPSSTADTSTTGNE